MARKSIFTLMAIVLVLALALVIPVFAQQSATTVTGTITVTGTGDASGSPNIANLTLGVEVVDADIKTAFNGANDRIAVVVDALVNAGVDAADIRTMGLNIYQERQPMGPEPTDVQSRYYVSNQVFVTVRDITKVADVINAAVEAGANSLYGLEFAISNSAALQSQARENAFLDAQARAAELAKLAGVEPGAVVKITELPGGGFYPPMAREQAMGGGGAVIQPGQMSVNVQLEVTFEIKR